MHDFSIPRVHNSLNRIYLATRLYHLMMHLATSLLLFRCYVYIKAASKLRHVKNQCIAETE